MKKKKIVHIFPNFFGQFSLHKNCTERTLCIIENRPKTVGIFLNVFSVVKKKELVKKKTILFGRNVFFFTAENTLKNTQGNQVDSIYKLS